MGHYSNYDSCYSPHMDKAFLIFNSFFYLGKAYKLNVKSVETFIHHYIDYKLFCISLSPRGGRQCV